MKEKLKVYHGLPKTPITDSTLFHASFDGSVHLYPNVPCTHNSNSYVFEPNVTGYGLRYPSMSESNIGLTIPNLNIPVDEFTVDVWFTPKVAVSNSYQGRYLGLRFNSVSGDANYYVRFERDLSGTKYHVWNNGNLAMGNFDFTSNTLDKPHHLRMCFRVGDYMKLFINGIETYDLYSNILNKNIKFIDIIDIGGCNSSISEVVITKGYNDYCFPTLPQDFIDGKAIVSPALNQRQSYGDPVLHQVTELLVPAQSETELGKYYSTSVRDADGYEQCLESPELYAGNWHNWAENYGKIRILGIDNTYITGVIDTDTAKCRVTQGIEESKTTQLVHVDSVSGINIGDRFWIYDSIMNNLWTESTTTYLEVTKIDATNNTLTLTTNLPEGFHVTRGDVLIEVTASSSSPIVKTVEGQVVNGTWSGLGTRVATFTIGANSGIAGKDLIVTYCLNAKGNVSPYPKMPSEVIRGYDELGNELVPTSTIEIKDDYKNRILNSSSNTCPHKLKYALEPNLRKPSDHWNEWEQKYYNNLNAKTPVSIASPILNHHAQILVELDLQAIIETKMGEKISGNVVDWLNSNIASIKCYATVLGNNDTNNNCSIKYFLPQSNAWGLNSGGATSNSSSFKTIIGQFSPNGTYLTSSKYYFLLHSDALSVNGDDSVKTRVQLQDIHFTVTLTNKSEYTYLFTERNEARNGETCNPILVDKQTKEVRRLLPSTKPFSTEVILYDVPTVNVTDGKEVLRGDFVLCTTHGSGSSCPTNDYFRGCIGKMGEESHLETNDYLHTTHIGSKERTKLIPRQYYVTSSSKNEFTTDAEITSNNTSFMSVGCDLFEQNSELYLRAFFQHITGNKRTSYKQIYSKIPNRPLIK